MPRALRALRAREPEWGRSAQTSRGGRKAGIERGSKRRSERRRRRQRETHEVRRPLVQRLIARGVEDLVALGVDERREGAVEALRLRHGHSNGHSQGVPLRRVREQPFPRRHRRVHRGPAAPHAIPVALHTTAAAAGVGLAARGPAPRPAATATAPRLGEVGGKGALATQAQLLLLLPPPPELDLGRGRAPGHVLQAVLDRHAFFRRV